MTPRCAAGIAALVATVSLVARPTGVGAASKRQLWDDRLDASTGAHALVVSPGGTQVFVTGATGLGAGSIISAAYDVSTGTRQWTATHAGTNDFPAAIGVSPDGASVFVTGDSGQGSNSDFLTLAYDAATGTELWASRYERSNADYPKDLKVSTDGSKVFVLGSVLGSRGEDFALVSYDAATGNEIWTSIFSSQGVGDDIPYSLAVSPDGSRLFATGISPGAGGVHDFLTVAFDASTGQPSWVARYHDPTKQQDQAFSLAVSPSGTQVFATGCISDTFAIGACGGLPDYQTIAYDAATGAREWVMTYNGPVNGVDIARSVGVSPDGLLVFATGDSDQLATTDYVTIAYDAATGDQQWLADYDGPTNRVEASCCLTVSASGTRVVITGWSTGFGTTNWATVAYEPATGHRLWTASYRGFKYYNYPEAVGITPDGGTAFVAGQITAATQSGYEWAVVAYRA